MKIFFRVLVVTTIIALSVFLFQHKKKNSMLPVPTEYQEMKNAKKEFKKNRKKWIEQMHRAAPGVNWQEMDAQTRADINMHKLDLRNAGKSGIFRNIQGEWNEKGSNNLAGRMLTVDYDMVNDVLYGASQGGNIWKGDLNGNWIASLNDNLQFNDVKMLKVLHIGNTTRILALQTSPAVLFYTDDEGRTWDTASGFSSNGNISRGVVINDSNIFVVKSIGNNTEIYKSSDYGENFYLIANFAIHSSKTDLWAANESNLFFIIGNELYKMNEDETFSLFTSFYTEFSVNNISKTILTGCFLENDSYLYSMYRVNDVAYIYQSMDAGITWQYKNQITNDYLMPFTVNSFSCSPTDPFIIYAGGMDCYKSDNGGETFAKINNWWDYYDDMEGKLHADIPEIKSIVFANAFEINFISTDGGTYISSDHLTSVHNISLQGLRISQYYSTYTSRNNTNIIFAGSQDQGLQRTLNGNENPTDLVQLISGDYGHVVSSDDGHSIWSVYPGFVIYYPNAETSEYYCTWDFEGSNYLWMPPIMADPDNSQAAYLAGGGLNGGAHLIHLFFNNNNISAEEMTYDFTEIAPNTQISAIACSEMNHAKMYVLTANGKFFYSGDYGQFWRQTEQFSGPGAHYFYGSSIKVSPVDDETIFIAGSGYSNPAVYVSYNGGDSFESFDQNLPQTLVYELAITDDANYLFAATEVGAFAYDLTSEDGWENIGGTTAPDQVYWCVDYIPSLNTARFGTYGRGIWDFVMGEVSSQPNEIFQDFSLKNFPNPVRNYTEISFSLPSYNKVELAIYNLKGQKVKTLISQNLDKGNHTAIWRGKDESGKEVSSGMYLYKLNVNGKDFAVKKCLLLK
jgi:photosystem II stability/assembly factor-like uncharacterized protein